MWNSSFRHDGLHAILNRLASRGKFGKNCIQHSPFGLGNAEMYGLYIEKLQTLYCPKEITDATEKDFDPIFHRVKNGSTKNDCHLNLICPLINYASQTFQIQVFYSYIFAFHNRKMKQKIIWKFFKLVYGNLKILNQSVEVLIKFTNYIFVFDYAQSGFQASYSHLIRLVKSMLIRWTVFIKYTSHYCPFICLSIIYGVIIGNCDSSKS